MSKYRCPKCGSDEFIQVNVSGWADLLPNGTLEPDRDSLEFNSGSTVLCGYCHQYGAMKDFEVETQAEEQAT